MAYLYKMLVSLSITTLLVVFVRPQNSALAEQTVPCYFIFGDSMVDNGNNNDLQTTAKANFPPYGIDYTGGPTGRFTNGRNLADFVAENLGFENPISPFATARDLNILRGVNYGSGAAGIRNETGQHLGARISMLNQLNYHQITISKIAVLLGNKKLAKAYLSHCIYTVTIGNNDYINNYFLPQFYQTSTLYTPEQYSEVLIQQYSQQLMTLYSYGARKVGLFGIGQLGCTPAEMTIYGRNGSSCVEMLNEAVQHFNDRLQLLIKTLNEDLCDANFIYVSPNISSYEIYSSGIRVLDESCCKVSGGLDEGQCEQGKIPCTNRTTYYFWDAFHPTETANSIIASQAYSAISSLFSSPVQIC